MSISTIAAFTKNAATCLADVPTGNAAGHTNSTKNETASAVFTKRWRWLQLLLLIMATTLAGMVGQAQTVTIGTGTLNVVGGFVVTDRMLEMFKKKTPAKKD